MRPHPGFQFGALLYLTFILAANRAECPKLTPYTRVLACVVPALRALLAARVQALECLPRAGTGLPALLGDGLPLENPTQHIKPGLLDSIVSRAKCRRVPIHPVSSSFNPVILPCLPHPSYLPGRLGSFLHLCCEDGSDLTETSSCAVLQKALCSSHVPRYFLTRESRWPNSLPWPETGDKWFSWKMVPLTA